MSLPDRNNPYSFNEFLEWRNSVDYYRDDPFIQKVAAHYGGDAAGEAHRAGLEISKKASFRWRDMSDSIAVPEKRPYMMHYDGHNNRIDRIVRPMETEVLEQEIFSEGFFSENTDPFVKLLKMFIIYQNGEACIACPLTCTEGMVALLDRFADSDELKEIKEHCKEGLDGHFAIGAQYLSEIQGGSDVPANVLEAEEENGVWKLYGTKFFCSATHADYAVVTAKPKGSEKVALFIVPSWPKGNREKEVRNGYTIDRIKWKLGTSELTTAELTFNGAVGYPVGPLDRGVANVVGIVLTYSRLTVGLSAAAFMTRAVREAVSYSRFRDAFGVKIGSFPLLQYQLNDMEKSAKRTTAGAFRLYREFLDMGGNLKGGLATDDDEETRRKRFNIRELIMLQKITAAKDSTEVVHNAMSVFGGHGVMEDFSCLPRLYRDSAVNELWEGPRNVLLTQIHRDLQRVKEWYPPEKFVRTILKGPDSGIVERLAMEFKELTEYPSLILGDERIHDICRRWDNVCDDFYHEYQNAALRSVEESVNNI